MRRLLFFLMTVLFLEVDCSKIPLIDTSPPRLLESSVVEGRLGFHFDEPVRETEFLTRPPNGAGKASVAGSFVEVPVSPLAAPGREYRYTMEVRDAVGNTTGLSGRFWAPNPQAAILKFSEIRTAGTGSRPDAVEFEVAKQGSLAGLCLDYTQDGRRFARFFFPEGAVGLGKLLVVKAPSDSGPSDVSQRAEVFCWGLPRGFSGTAGLFVVRSSPDGPAQDEFLYGRDPKVTKKFEAAYKKKEPQAWTKESLWDGPPWEPSLATATRTWCRKKPWAEGPGKATQWVLVANGQATLGDPNKLIPYVPKAPRDASVTAKASKKKKSR